MPKHQSKDQGQDTKWNIAACNVWRTRCSSTKCFRQKRRGLFSRQVEQLSILSLTNMAWYNYQLFQLSSDFLSDLDNSQITKTHLFLFFSFHKWRGLLYVTTQLLLIGSPYVRTDSPYHISSVVMGRHTLVCCMACANPKSNMIFNSDCYKCINAENAVNSYIYYFIISVRPKKGY